MILASGQILRKLRSFGNPGGCLRSAATCRARHKIRWVCLAAGGSARRGKWSGTGPWRLKDSLTDAVFRTPPALTSARRFLLREHIFWPGPSGIRADSTDSWIPDGNQEDGLRPMSACRARHNGKAAFIENRGVARNRDHSAGPAKARQGGASHAYHDACRHLERDLATAWMPWRVIAPIAAMVPAVEKGDCSKIFFRKSKFPLDELVGWL